MKSQAKHILKHLKKGFSLTPLAALNMFGTMKLSTRVSELKKDGNKIKSEFIETVSGKRVKKYWM